MIVDDAGRRRGWDLVTSRPLTDDQRRRADEIARVELPHKGGKRGRTRPGPAPDTPRDGRD